jgi:hypothetical protein
MDFKEVEDIRLRKKKHLPISKSSKIFAIKKKTLLEKTIENVRDAKYMQKMSTIRDDSESIVESYASNGKQFRLINMIHNFLYHFYNNLPNLNIETPVSFSKDTFSSPVLQIQKPKDYDRPRRTKSAFATFQNYVQTDENRDLLLLESDHAYGI